MRATPKKCPRPTGPLSEKQIALFHARGFLSLEQISSPAEIRILGPVFERLFQESAGRSEGNHYDLVGHDDDDVLPTLPSIINPVNYAPRLRNLAFRRNAFSIAQQLLGPSVTPAFEQAILKPARYGAATPWHQDEAYRVDAGFEYNQVSFWMPLMDVDIQNGCMQYIPQSNLGPVLPHHWFQDDPKIHAIECVGVFDVLDAYACPLPAGGVVMHGGRTLHYSGPNPTEMPRYAYILAFETPPRRLPKTRDFHWNRERQLPNKLRRSEWRKRGGIAIEAIRKYHLGMLNSPARILFELRRSLRALAHLLRRRH
jgi:hypothetical protein